MLMSIIFLITKNLTTKLVISMASFYRAANLFKMLLSRRVLDSPVFSFQSVLISDIM